MKKKHITGFIALIFTASLVSGCNVSSKILGEYEYSDTVYIGLISSSTLDYMKEKKADTQYIIEKDSLTITLGDEKTQLFDITYEKEEFTDELIKESYMAEDTALIEFFDGYDNRYRYSIYDENGDKLGYYIFLMDDDVFICKYAKSDVLFFWIDKIAINDKEE